MASRNTAKVTLLTAAMLLAAGGLRAEGLSLPAPANPDTTNPVAQKPLRESVDEKLAQEIYDLTARRPDDLKKLIHEVLCTYIENPDTVRIAIELGSPIERLAGRIRRVEVALEGSIIKKLKMDRGFIILEDIVLDLPKLIRDKKFRFREKGTTRFLFDVSETALNQLILEKEKKLKVRRARLRLENGRMVFTGKMKLIFFNNNVRLDGSLWARKGTEVHFRPRSLHLNFLPVPGFMLGIIKRKLNPVADLKNFRFNVDIGKIQMTKSRVLIGSSDVTEYILEQAKLERSGKEYLPKSWPPAQFSQMIAEGQYLVNSATGGGATLAERVLTDR